MVDRGGVMPGPGKAERIAEAVLCTLGVVWRDYLRGLVTLPVQFSLRRGSDGVAPLLALPITQTKRRRNSSPTGQVDGKD